MFATSFFVFLGGGVGSLLRWSFSLLSRNFFNTGWQGTLAVNVIGSLLMVYLFREVSTLNPQVQNFIRIGFLGGLTTFSTFSFELFDAVKSGQLGLAFTIFMLNMICGVIVGILIFR